MNFTLTRFAYSPLGTFGILEGEGFKCFTIEEVWRNNQRSISCIPEGTYTCKRGQFPKHGDTFEVMNVPNRSAILFHVANTIADIEGCIGLGDALGVPNGTWGIVNSRTTYNAWKRLLDGVQDFQLFIKSEQRAWV